MLITGTANERIKRLRALIRDKKTRYNLGEYVAEGTIITKDLPKELISEIYIKESAVGFSHLYDEEKTVFVKDGIFDSVADTVTPSGVIAVLKIPEPKEVCGERTLLLCGLGDAGNVGTIIRTACAAGINTVVCVNTADPFSPKAVRASMGGIVKVNVVQCSYDEAFDLLSEYDIVALDMDGICIYDYKKRGKIAIAVGNEAHGIPDIVREKSSAIVTIPMVKNGVESLNAAVSASIATYILR